MDRLVLTWNAGRLEREDTRQFLLAAAERAGFAETELLPGAVAAAFAPGRPPVPAGSVVLVYDLGSLGCRAGLVLVDDPADHELLGHAWEPGCGGKAADDLVVEHIRGLGGEALAAAAATGHLDPEAGRLAALRFGLELREAATRARHELSRSPHTADCVTPAAPAFELRRETLEELLRPLVDASLDACRDLLDDHGLAPEDLSHVVAVGGMTRTPLVVRALRETFPVPVRRPRHPELGLVQGATALVRATPPRLAAPMPPAGERPLGWAVPGARVQRWLVEPGERYAAGAALAVVRMPDGSLRRLRAPDRAGTLVRRHAPPGAVVDDGDWLVTVASAASAASASAASRPAPPAPGAERSGAERSGAERSGSAAGPRTIRHGGAVTAVAFSPDGGRLVTGGTDEAAAVWDAATGERVLTLPYGGRVGAVAFSPDGATVAAGGGRRSVLLWEARTGRRVRAVQDRSPVTALAFDPGGTLLALVTEGGGTAVVDATDGTQVWRRPVGSDCAAVSTDGQWLVTGAGQQALVQYLRTGTTRTVLGRSPAHRHAGAVGDVAFAPGGRFVATAGADGRVMTWDLETGELLWRSPEIGGLPRLVLLGDDLLGAVGGSTVTWHAATGEVVRGRSPAREVLGVAARPGGGLLALALPGGSVDLVATADLFPGGAR